MKLRDLNRAGIKTEDGYWLILVAILVLVICGILMSGCQTVHGLALDVESAARYTADHTKCDR